MKKTLLLGCIAAGLTCASFPLLAAEAPTPAPAVATAPTTPAPAPATTASAVVIPTIEQVKQTLESVIAWPGEITVTPNGDDFDITLGAVSDEDEDDGKVKSLSARSVKLTRAGAFVDQAQYKLSLASLDYLQDLLALVDDDIKLTAATVQDDLIVVPAYQLIANRATRATDAKMSTADGTLALTQLTSDILARPLAADKMDMSAALDMRDMTLTTQNGSLKIPALTAYSLLTNAPVVGVDLTRQLLADKFEGTFEIPTIQIFPTAGTNSSLPMATGALSGKARFQDDTYYFETKLTQLQTAMPVPANLMPTEITLNLDITGLNKQDLLTLTDDKSDDARQHAAIQHILESGTIILHELQVQNAGAGLMLTGTARAKFDVSGNPQPVVDATLTIRNLDTISPVPTVDEARCAQAKKDFATPTDEQDKQASQMMIEMACAPQGGMLDIIRPYLTAGARTTDPDGATVDTLKIQFQDGKLTLNGKAVQ